jgi:hypothetical protein
MRWRTGHWFHSGLPDDTFFKPKILNWEFTRRTCNGRCWYIICPFGLFTAICYILWPIGIFHGYLVYFFPFWYIVPRKIWQPWFQFKWNILRACLHLVRGPQRLLDVLVLSGVVIGELLQELLLQIVVVDNARGGRAWFRFNSFVLLSKDRL